MDMYIYMLLMIVYIYIIYTYDRNQCMYATYVRTYVYGVVVPSFGG